MSPYARLSIRTSLPLVFVLLIATALAESRPIARPAPVDSSPAANAHLSVLDSPAIRSLAPPPPTIKQVAAPSNVAGVWTPASPAGSLPAVNAIAIDGPALAEGTHIVVATSNGLYLSTNGGSNWRDWNEGLTGRSATSVVSSAGGFFYAVVEGLVYRRDPGDASWSMYSAELPSNPGTVDYLAIGADGILFAADADDGTAGAQRVFSIATLSASSAWVDLSAGLPIYGVTALTVGSGQVYVSIPDNIFARSTTDPQGAWSSIVAAPLSLGSNAFAQALATDADGSLYAGLGGTNGGVWRFQSNAWISLNTTTLSGVGIRSLAVAQNSTNRKIFAGSAANGLYVGDESLGSVSWLPTGLAGNTQVAVIALSPAAFSRPSGDRVILVGNAKGLLRSSTLGGSFSPANDGLAIGLSASLLSFANDRTLFAVSAGGFYRSTDGGASWTTRETPEAVTAFVPSPNYSLDGHLFIAESSEYCKNIGSLERSVDHGATWTAKPLSETVDALFSSSAIQSDNTIFAASFGLVTNRVPDCFNRLDGVLRSTNRGDSWSYINTGLIGQSFQSLAITPSPGAAPDLLAGTDTGIFSFDSASSSSSWSDFNGGQVITGVRQIVYSPTFASDGAIFALASTGLYNYVSGLQHWQALATGALPLADVRHLAVSPNHASDHTLFATTDREIWMSRDNGASWGQLSRVGLPDLGIPALTISPDFASDQTIFVSTAGQGIFKYSLPPPAPPWLVLLYLGGQDRGGDQSLDESIRLMLDRLGQMPGNPAARIVALYDGNQAGDTAIYMKDGQASGLRQIQDLPPELSSRELDTGRTSTLKAFIRWARETYPGSRYTMLSIVDHGGGWAPDFGGPAQKEGVAFIEAGGWRGLGLDVSSPDQVTSLSTKETGLALRDLGVLGHFDIVFFDACLMGTIESAYEIQPYTDYFIAGENLLWSNLPYDQYLAPVVLDSEENKGLTPTTTSEIFTKHIVDLYDKFTPPDQPFTIAALDMRKLPDLRSKTNTLAKLLLDAVNTDPAAGDRVREAYSNAQKFDYDANLRIDSDKEGSVDLAHFAYLVLQDAALPEAHNAAEAVFTAITDTTQGAVINIKKKSSDTPKQGAGPWTFDHAYGISIYMPLGERDCRPTGPIDDPDDPECTPTGLTAGGGRPAVERQLKYYANANQLAFTRDAPKWAELLDTLDARFGDDRNNPDYIRDLGTQPFHSPFMLRTQWSSYLPLLHNGQFGTDLVVIGPLQALPANPQAGQPVEIRVTIKNSGSADITRPFWVDFYVDPRETPRPNRLWPDIGQYGAAWRVYSLGAGDSVTLSTKHPDDPRDPGARYSNFTSFVQSGTHQLFVLVDAFAEGRDNGALDEDSEANNGYGPQDVVVTGMTTSQLSAQPVLDSRSGK